MLCSVEVAYSLGKSPTIDECRNDHSNGQLRLYTRQQRFVEGRIDEFSWKLKDVRARR